MKNPVTTIVGALTLVGAIASYLVTFLQTHAWPPSPVTIVAAIVGIIGIITSDGGL